MDGSENKDKLMNRKLASEEADDNKKSRKTMQQSDKFKAAA